MTAPLITLHNLLEAIGYDDTETTTLNTQAPGGRFTTRPATLTDLATWEPDPDRDTWYGVNPVRPGTTGRGTATDITRLAAIWVDLDIKPGACPDMDTARTITAALSDMLGTNPVATVYSGHGMQPLWAIDHHPITTPDDTQNTKALLRRWGRLVTHVAELHGAGVDSVFDLPRILRAPGTRNHKTEPVAVLAVPGTGYPISVTDLNDTLTAYNVLEQPGDRDDLGAPITNPDQWAWADHTCTYAAKTTRAWSTETPTARHPWLMSCAVRLAAMRANGCITADDYNTAAATLAARFEHLLATGDPKRAAHVGEIREAFTWATARVSTYPPTQVAKELGNHPHLTAAPATPGDPFATGLPAPTPTNVPTGTDAPTPAPAATVVAVNKVGEHYGPTEDGTAQALVHLHHNQLRYCPQRGQWLTWTGSRWQWDIQDTHRQLIREIARDLPGGEGWSSYKKRALSAAGVTGIARLAQSDPAVTIHIDDLDNNPYELNTPGGIINLRTGTLRPADPQALHTRTTTVTPDFNAHAPHFDRFLTTTFGGDQELIGYVQRLLGVAIIGTVLEQILPFAHGSGANGKSTLFEVVMHALGRGEDGYAMSVPSEMLMVRKHSEHPAELAQLAGARLAIASELEDGARFAEARIKQLTGRDSINARFMRRDPFTFTPSHTIVLIGNHKPQTTTGGPAFWRRLALIPFEHVVDEAERDPHLSEKLEDEAGAILAWIAAGAAEYLRAGLRPPAAIREATEQYAHEQDTVGRFVDERCTLGPAQRVAVSELRDSYGSWCTENGETPVSPKRFSQEILTRFDGIEAARSRTERSFRGIGLTVESVTGDGYDEPGSIW